MRHQVQVSEGDFGCTNLELNSEERFELKIEMWELSVVLKATE